MKFQNLRRYLTDCDYRFSVNDAHGLYRSLDDETYIKKRYHAKFGRKLNLECPKTFNEKLQWLKLHDRKPIYTQMVDKVEAKKLVADAIGDEYIIPTLGVWNRFEDIDFDALPDQFVLKCSHDSGGLAICRDKKKFDLEGARKKINASLSCNYYWRGREWPYKDVRPRILAEKYMEDASDGLQESPKGITDYKFFCINGKPQLLYVSRGLDNHLTAELSFYGMDGVEKTFRRRDYRPYHNANIPENFDEMKAVAEKLAGFVACPFVRIDLYSIDNHVYFSEITFSPCSGMIPFEPESADEELGKLLYLPIDETR